MIQDTGRRDAPRTDHCIVTVREDEFEAVLQRLDGFELLPGKVHSDQFYAVGRLTTGSGSRTVTVVRCTFRGNQEALTVTRDALEDLEPRFVFVCGIAGGLPSADFCLGDVVLGTEVYDFSVGAAKPGGRHEYSLHSGPPQPIIRGLLGILPALPLEDWASSEALKTIRPQDLGTVTPKLDSEWHQRVEDALTAAADRARPRRVIGPIGSSDDLIQDPQMLVPLLGALRRLHAVEMESAGISKALLRDHVPFLPVRAISDVIGLTRVESWTPYACATAASFLIALLKNTDVDRLLTPFFLPR